MSYMCTMQVQELHVYLSALAYEALVGDEEATAHHFRLLPKADREKFGRIASAVQDGATVAAGIAQQPSIDPVTGDKLNYTERSEYGIPECAERAGLLPLPEPDAAELERLTTPEPKPLGALRKTR